MPFIPRSQQPEQAAAQPPSMAVVENRQPQIATTAASNDEQAEQIAELNELLVHVLDEISSLKDTIYQNTRRDSRRSTRGAKGKRGRHVTEEESDESSGDDSEAEAEETATKSTSHKGPPAAAPATTPRRSVDFSSCF